jgi:DNA-binding XRE family transcriptional regulator
MAAEILKLVQELKDQGYTVGATVIEDVTLSLEHGNLIPPSVHEQNPVLKGSFSEQIIGYRKQHELSQRDLAEIIGIDHSTLSRLEHKNRKPNFGTVKAIIRGLDLNEEQTLNLLASFH